MSAYIQISSRCKQPPHYVLSRDAILHIQISSNTTCYHVCIQPCPAPPSQASAGNLLASFRPWNQGPPKRRSLPLGGRPIFLPLPATQFSELAERVACEAGEDGPVLPNLEVAEDASARRWVLHHFERAANLAAQNNGVESAAW